MSDDSKSMKNELLNMVGAIVLFCLLFSWIWAPMLIEYVRS